MSDRARSRGACSARRIDARRSVDVVRSGRSGEEPDRAVPELDEVVDGQAQPDVVREADVGLAARRAARAGR